MKKLFTLSLMAVALAATTSAQTRLRKARGADGGEAVAKGQDAYCQINTMSDPGGNCLASAPNLQANGRLLPPLGGRPRQWIVLEAKYTTMAKWQDELTFTWHILLDSAKAKEIDPKRPPSKYSYYTTQVRYVDIKRGQHMASVCLPPSVYERFGEPCAIALLVTNKEGDTLSFMAKDSDANVKKAAKSTDGKWWDNNEFMSWKKKDENMIERRQGLLDRSKTPFWLVNNADYEMVM